MKTLTFRLPEGLIAGIEADARIRHVTRSDVVRERLASYAVRSPTPQVAPSFRDLAGDLIGYVSGDGLPSDLSSRKNHYLESLGYGKNRNRR